MSKILEVGTKIRSYYFLGVADYFIEGAIEVVDTWNYAYGVKVTKTVRGGKEVNGDGFVYVDFMSQRMVDEEWARIEVIV